MNHIDENAPAPGASVPKPIEPGYLEGGDDKSVDEGVKASPGVKQPLNTGTPMAVSQDMADELAMEQFEEAKRAGLPTAKMLGVMQAFAQHCVQTGQLPRTIDTSAKVIMVFQAGREMGIPPIKSLNSFYFVNNKLSMYGSTVIERIRNWATIEYGECNDKTATVKITRKDDGTSLSSTVTMADLDARGVTKSSTGKKDTFTKHPRTMLIYKAVGEIVRHIVPEAVGAMAVEGDFGPSAEYEIIHDREPRAGKVLSDKTETAVESTEEASIPTVPQIVRKYDREVIAARLKEFGVKFDAKATKGQLATMLVGQLEKKKLGLGVED